jgi:phytoene dehydrogenase-like protein
MLRRFGRHGLLRFAGNALSTCRDWTTATFEAPEAHGLLAPWVLHTGLGPDNAVSGFMTQVIACAVQLGGMPVPAGGGIRLVDALSGIVRDAGGELRTGAEVDRVVVAGGRSVAVTLADGETIGATRAVIAGVTPTQLYGSLLRVGDVPADVHAAAGRYRYGRAGMQIHLALDEPPRWQGPDAERLGRTAIVHVTPGLDGVSRAVNEAERGLLPAEATIVAGQPCAVDPGRAPEGKWIVWIQLQELPAGPVKGDAAGELDVGDGLWTEDLREAYADRIVARLGRSIENLASATLARTVLSPADLEALDCNLVGGDIYAGSCALDQNLVWRPFAAAPGHRTTVEGLWHVGASTHPGPGLGAGSGYLVAKELTKPPLPRRLLARVPGRS